ncbi:WXG100 family type VII secretion target [Actinoplanes sp. NPDC049265]|uniref:WXG100 family type VII secretion target n=1 Tax=Actinoplanes sp. NPDC049265 TaxID=3363902 RepID=UPI00371F71C7
MSDAPLTSSWCTNWGSFNTPRLWAMVADEDDPEAWRQVAAWGDVAIAVKDQHNRLKAAKEALIAAWPPAQNASADAFVTELDNLLTRMDSARTDADATADGLANILESLRQAKAQIKPLYEQYKDKNSDWVPGWFDNAEDEIDEQARNIMITTEQVVEQNVPSLKVPDPYQMDPNAKSGYTPPAENDAGQGGSHYSGPPTSSSAGGGGSSSYGPVGSSSGAGPGSHTEIAVPHDPVPPLPGMDPIAPSDGGGGGGSTVGSTGPDLAGVTPLPGPPPVVTPSPGVPPVIGGPPVTPGPGPAILPGLPPTPPIGGGGGPIGATKPLTSTNFRSAPVGGRGALPSGAVIGETVGRSGPGAGRPGSVSAGNVGRGGLRASSGVRGGQKPPRPSWLPPEESAGIRNTASQTGLSNSRRPNGRDEDTPDGPHFDPDNPWQTDSGVAPVIKPQTSNPRHDPGPNVIGGYRG